MGSGGLACIGLAWEFFRAMQELLRFNIGNLESSFLLDQAVSNIATRVDEAIPTHLFYACKFWCDHMLQSKAAENLVLLVESFLRQRILFWIEALNLKRGIQLGVLALSKLNSEITVRVCFFARKFLSQ